MSLRIGIIAQEEPVCFGPFLRAVIEARAEDVAVVVLAGSRGAGNHPRSWKERFTHIRILWLMMEPSGFMRSVFIRSWAGLLRVFGLIGSPVDHRSVEGAARRHKIPVVRTDDVNGPATLEHLRTLQLDVIINQTEIFLKKPLLGVPRLGVINRHASLLPRFRGRVGSFWSHAAEPPEYGVTVHFVDKGIDSGAIIARKAFDLDPSSGYSDVLDELFQGSVGVMLEALKNLEDPAFSPCPNAWQGTRPCLFPTLEDVLSYRKVLERRRKSAASRKSPIHQRR